MHKAIYWGRMLSKNAAQNVLMDITFRISRWPTIYDLYTLHNKAKIVTHVTVEETHAHLTFVYQDLDSREQAQLQMNKPRPDLVFILKGTLIFKVILILSSSWFLRSYSFLRSSLFLRLSSFLRSSSFFRLSLFLRSSSFLRLSSFLGSSSFLRSSSFF